MQAASAQRLLITGATGCVGQYLVDELLANSPHHLVLLVRNPSKLPDFGADAARITVIQADVTDVAGYRDRLGRIDAAFLIAACWGGPETEAVNLTANLELTDLLAQSGAARVFYFATASVLDHEHALLKPAWELGSDYVRSKYRLVTRMEERAGGIDVVGLFPTIIVGGGADGKPLSHFANLLHEARPYMRLACALSAEGKLHHIHARDIARVARRMLDAPRAAEASGRRVVLGNPAVTIDQFLGELRSYFGYWSPVRLRLTDRLAEFFIKLFRIKPSPWDRYCMHHRDMSHRDPVSPATLGLQTHAPDMAAQLRAVGIAPKR